MVRQVIALLVFICLIVIAGSLGSMSHYAFGLTIRESAIIGFAVLACLAALQSYLMVSRRLEILEREINVSFSNFGRFKEELAKLTAHVDAGDESTKNQMAQRASNMQTDIAAMTGIARKIAERTARLENRLNEMQTKTDALQSVQNNPHQNHEGDARPNDNTKEPSARPIAAATPQPEGLVEILQQQANKAKEEDRNFMVDLIATALSENSFELHLQSGVTLPNRRPCNYEALVRFKEADGTLIEAAECLSFAKDAGLLAELDFKIASNAFTVARRLVDRKSRTPIFVNISNDLLSDGQHFSQFFAIAQANKEIAESIVFEIAQNQLAGFAALETESLGALRDLGYQFSLDFVLDRQVEAAAMFEIGFRHLKMPVDILTSDENVSKLDIHPQDLADFMRREGINLVATHIEHESQVVKALEYGVKFGQGNLFAPPKPVRIDLLKPDVKPQATRKGIDMPSLQRSA